MLEKLSMKRIYIIIGSVILAILILLSVIFFLGKSDKKHDKSKVSGKVDSSMVDESSDKDSSDENSSSTDDSKTDSKTDLSSTGDSSAVVTDVQGRVIPTSPSGGGTQPSGGGTTKTPTGTTTTTPSTQTMTISLASFSPYAEKNITTGLGMSVFEYIFGKETIESGIPTKCIQQRDTVVLKTNQPITKLDFDSSLINATYSGNTITVTAKNITNKPDPDKTFITVNGKYKYKINIYREFSYYNATCSFEISYLYWTRHGGEFMSKSDVRFSSENILSYNGPASVKNIISLLEGYRSKHYTKLNVVQKSGSLTEMIFSAN